MYQTQHFPVQELMEYNIQIVFLSEVCCYSCYLLLLDFISFSTPLFIYLHYFLLPLLSYCLLSFLVSLFLGTVSRYSLLFFLSLCECVCFPYCVTSIQLCRPRVKPPVTLRLHQHHHHQQHHSNDDISIRAMSLPFPTFKSGAVFCLCSYSCPSSSSSSPPYASPPTFLL